MKKFKGIAVVLAILAVVGAVMLAFNDGQKSPIIVKGHWQLESSLAAKTEGISTLFLVIYDNDSPMPMPFGAVKEYLKGPVEAGKKYEFFITNEKIQKMRPDAPLPKNLRLKARLDLDGIAGRDQPGDITGEISPIPLGTDNIDLAINKYIGS